MREIFTDTLSDGIYFAGESSLNGDNNFDDAAIAFYSQNHWDTIGPMNGVPECLIRWGDTLVVGGQFIINGLSIVGCAGYIDGAWFPFGDFGFSSPTRFRVIDGELYAVGGFTQADGHTANGIAKRVGAGWLPVGSPSGLNTTELILDVIQYNGQLIIAGGSFDWTEAHGISVLNDTIWEPLGPGILGNLGFAATLAEYQNELYVGGGIHVAQGNSCEGIVKWTGSEFIPVGNGLQNDNNQAGLNVGATAMRVHNDLLYVTGVFWYAGGVPAMGIATWDGANWCGLGGALEMPVQCIDFFHDTLYVGPLIHAEGIDVNCAATYVGNYPDTCTQFSTSILDPTLLPAAIFQIILASDILIAHLPIGAPPCRMELLDGLGRVINAGIGTTVRFSTTGLAKGVYIVRAEGYGAQRVLLE